MPPSAAAAAVYVDVLDGGRQITFLQAWSIGTGLHFMLRSGFREYEVE